MTESPGVGEVHTPAPLAVVLDGAGFACTPRDGTEGLFDRPPSDWWELANERHDIAARVVVTAQDGIDVYAFTGGRAMLLAWQARFDSSTPLPVLGSIVDQLVGWGLAEAILADVADRKAAVR